MSNAGKLIQDLILFYVKENYIHYLKEENIKKIPDEKIKEMVQKIYGDKKEHIRTFLKVALKDLMEEKYIGDLALMNICNEIFEDDELCINRLTLEITNYQNDN
jgi:hypothetical protein|tara:strand:- start:350 stop:661 length:312 start_codon:yes stop_codon:yes gene_type:complete